MKDFTDILIGTGAITLCWMFFVAYCAVVAFLRGKTRFW